jgi:hypothetical protein
LGVASLLGSRCLTPESELRDEISISIDIPPAEVLEQPPSPPDHTKQAAARVVILRMTLEMLGKFVYAARQHGNLNLRRTRVALSPRVLSYQLLFFVFDQSHARLSSEAPWGATP